jgi:dTDP-glucose 4,6-dehydratase
MSAHPILLVAGGAGFIGANFVHHVRAVRPEWDVRVLDALTYAGDRRRLEGAGCDLIVGDIADTETVQSALDGVTWLVNFAAETHVDRSLLDAEPFLRTNVTGTYRLFEAARLVGVVKAVHVSTDEVYGETRGAAFVETDPPAPRNPYSASKAAGELMVLASWRTHQFPVCITRGVNTIGPWQHPEKAVPLFTINAMRGQPLPLYGRGEQQRDRLHVDDHASAILTVLERGEPGEVYNVAADNNRDNLTVARRICERAGAPQDLIHFVEDRTGHDWNYALDSAKLQSLGWSRRHDFAAALDATVDWYLEARDWWAPIVDGEFQAYYARQYAERLAGAEAFRG